MSANSAALDNSGNGIPIPFGNDERYLNHKNEDVASSSATFLPHQVSQSAPSNFHQNPFRSPFAGQVHSATTINPSLIQEGLSNEDISSDLMLTEHLFPLTIGNNEQDITAFPVNHSNSDMSRQHSGMANSSSSLIDNTQQQDTHGYEFEDFASARSINPSAISASLPNTSNGSSSPIFFSSNIIPDDNAESANTSGLSQSYQNTSASNALRFNNRPRRAISSASSTFEPEVYSHADSAANSFPGTRFAPLDKSRVSTIVESDKLEKRRRRRESHNAVERRRRDLINEKIRELSQIVPDLIRDDKLNKGVILTKSVDYILTLQNENAQLKMQLQKHFNS